MDSELNQRLKNTKKVDGGIKRLIFSSDVGPCFLDFRNLQAGVHRSQGWCSLMTLNAHFPKDIVREIAETYV